MHSRSEDDDDEQKKVALSVTTSGWPGALTLLGFFALIGFVVWVCCSAGGLLGGPSR